MPVRGVLLAGVGDGSPAAWRSAGAAVGRAPGGGSPPSTLSARATEDALAAWVEGAVARGFRGAPVDRRGRRAPAPRPPARRWSSASSPDARGPSPGRSPRPPPSSVARGLALTPVEHQEPRVAGRRGRAPRPPRRARRDGVGRDGAARPRASAGCWPSGRARPPRRGWSGWTTTPAGGDAPRTPRVVLVGQGHHLRQRRPAGQAPRRHARDEDRHVRARGSSSASLVAVRASSRSRSGSPACSRSPRTPSAAPSYRPGDVVTQYGGSDRRDRQHRRRGPDRPGRRARLRRRAPRPRRPGRRRDPHRGRPGGAWGGRWPRSSRPTTALARRPRGGRRDDW